MYISERQAELVKCPRFLGMEGTPNQANPYCIGQFCMAWRIKKDVKIKEFLDVDIKSIGYCGLAGKPESDLVCPDSKRA